MKKISKSVFVIGAVVMLALGATFAYFADTEILAENTLASGTLDLKVDGVDNPTSSINIADLLPGESREFTWTLRNDGSVTGIPSITFGEIANFENDMTEPEAIADTTPEAGELGSRTKVKLAWSQNGGTFKNIRLSNSLGNPELDDISNITVGLGLLSVLGPDNAIPHLANGEEVVVRLTVTLPSTVGNIIQSDSATFDMTYNLSQG